ncbi:hypothetical protein [Algiphilus sp.]|uniref:hypothetical protein n=1 Tax=Algiphilus sp. TaxID=1872431 RepID=UPI0025C52D54|nr:hypothetical protein [Algiphilus sp.]MCK5770445.1 hypothetical protein [Algiphilus sp.]
MTQTATPEPVDSVYAMVSGDDDVERICSTIPDSACRHAPRNYLLNLANGAATKLAEQLAGPRLALPWLLAAHGAPAVAVSALMPIKQAASLLPQLLMAGAVRARPVRKWLWVAAGCTQAGSLILMLAAVLTLPPVAMAASVLALLALFSAASGLASLAFQDVIAKTVGKGVRGNLLANRAMAGGLLAFGAGLLMQFALDGAATTWLVVALLGGGALLWLAAAASLALTVEAPGATDGGRNPIDETRAGIALVRSAPGYRRYLATRFLLLPVELAAPLFVLAAQDAGGGALLGLILAAMALADIFSSRLWGDMADRAPGRVLALAGAAGAAAAVGMLLLVAAAQTPDWLHAMPFALLGVAESGVRLGRKTWLVDACGDGERATAVAFGNTLTGIAALLFVAIGALGMASGAAPLAAVALLAVLGGVLALRLPATLGTR